jgi:NADPH2:quinone reductase
VLITVNPDDFSKGDNMMRAVLCHAFGSFENLTLEDVQSSEMIPHGVKIAVHAAGMCIAANPMIEGKYQRKPSFPFIPGVSVAGIVTEVANEMTRIKPGDRVYAGLSYGAYAEEAVVPEDNCFCMPDEMDFVTATLFPTDYVTSYGALNRCAKLKKGGILLVHGAAGVVGRAAVELGKAMGVQVIATAGSDEHTAIAQVYGADHTINYTRYPIRDSVFDLTEGHGVDVVYDPVGGETFTQSWRCIAPEGRILVIGFAGGSIQQIPANLLLVKNITVMGYFGWHFRMNHPEWVEAEIAQMFEWAHQGTIKPVVDHPYDISDF